MYFTNAQRPLYNVCASVSPEAETSNLGWSKAHAAFNMSGIFVRVTSPFMGGLRVESSDSPITLDVGIASTRGLPSKLAIWSAGLKNLLSKETAMSSQSQLYDALEALINHNLTSELSEAAQLRIEAMTRTILSAAVDAEFPASVAAVAIDLYQISRLFAQHQEA